MENQIIKFTPIYLAENQGHGNARRISLDACSNDLIALMDADDISYPYRFEKQLEIFSKKNVDIVGGQITEFTPTPQNIISRREVPLLDGEIKSYLKKRCPMNQVSVMLKKSAYDKAGGYIDWYCEEDYYLWARMALKDCVFENASETLVNVRVGDEMSARRGGIKYYRSEKKMQKFLLKNKLISFPRYVYNVAIRLCGEVLCPNFLRTKLFKFTRSAPKQEMLENDYTPCKEIEKLPKFSVAMCVYGKDNAEWFDTALKSVVEQTVKPSEIVLVVDGPIPDEIKTIIEKYENMLTEKSV